MKGAEGMGNGFFTVCGVIEIKQKGNLKLIMLCSVDKERAPSRGISLSKKQKEHLTKPQKRS